MEETYHMYGMKITVSGDIEEARRRGQLARKLMFQTKNINSNNLDIIKGNMRLDDGTAVEVLSQHGLDSAKIYVPPVSKKKKKKKITKTETFLWPAFRVGGGVVICMGGGFDPPYEFIPVTDDKRLPYDDWLEAKKDEDLDEDETRTWLIDDPRFVQRLFEDIAPAGRGAVLPCALNPYSWDGQDTVGMIGLVSQGETTHVIREDYWQSTPIIIGLLPSEWDSFKARATGRWRWSRTGKHYRQRGLTVYYRDEDPPVDAYWPIPAYYTGDDGQQYPNELQIERNSYDFIPGFSTAYFYLKPISPLSLPLSLNLEFGVETYYEYIGGRARSFAQDSGLRMVGEGAGAYFVTGGSQAETEEKAKSMVLSWTRPDHSTRSDESWIKTGFGTETDLYENNFAIKNQSEYGGIVSTRTERRSFTEKFIDGDIWDFLRISGRYVPDEGQDDEPVFSPMQVVLDTEVKGTIPGQGLTSCTQKYFDILERTGIFLAFAKVDSGKWAFVYADQEKMVLTEGEEDEVVPGDMKDWDGEVCTFTRYHSFRLIRETRTTEQIVDEHEIEAV